MALKLRITHQGTRGAQGVLEALHKWHPMQVTDRFDRIGGTKGFVAQYTVHLRGADEEFLGVFLYGLSDDLAHGQLLVQARRAARGNEDGMNIRISAHRLES